MNPASRPDVSPYDALLLLSFGGPEKPDGRRAVPRERHARARHPARAARGGGGALLPLRRAQPDQRPEPRPARRDRARTSPAAGSTSRSTGATATGTPTSPTPWTQMRDDGITRAAVLTTSAYSSYSSCRQYRENLADAVAAVAGAPRLDRLRQLLQPPRLRRARRRRHASPRSPSSPTRRRAAPTWSSSPTRSPPRWPRPAGRPRPAAPTAVAPTSPSTAAVDVVAARVREETGRRHEHDLVYCSRSGSPRTPWLEPDVNDHLADLAKRGVVAGRAGADRLRLRPHGGHLRPRHRGDGHRREARPRGRARAATPGIDPRFVAMVRDLLVERAAAERGEDVGSSLPWGTCSAWPEICAAGLLPQPARSAPGPVRVGLMTPSATPTSIAAARPGPRRRARGRRRWPGEMRGGGIDVADTKSSAVDVVTEADRAGEELIRAPDPAPSAPTTRSWGRRATTTPGTSGVRWVVDPIDGTVNYLYGLPDWAVSIAAEVDGEVVAGVVVTDPTGVEYAAALGAGATRDGQRHRRTSHPAARRAAGPDRLRLPQRGPRPPGRVRRRPAAARCVTSVGWARARSTCATSPTAAATPTSRRGPGRGTAAPAGWSLTRGRRPVRRLAGRLHDAGPGGTRQRDARRGRRAPADGWDSFVDALRARGLPRRDGRGNTGASSPVARDTSGPA